MKVREWKCQYWQGTCVHRSCGRKAGVLAPITEFNDAFEDQLRNWLRFHSTTTQGRRTLARLYWVLKDHWHKTGDFSILTCVRLACGPPS